MKNNVRVSARGSVRHLLPAHFALTISKKLETLHSRADQWLDTAALVLQTISYLLSKATDLHL